MSRSLLVVGGNGLVGSAVCRVAVGRGWDVTSLSRTGQPYVSPKGHQPAWSHKVTWRAGSALDPSVLADILPGVSNVVHTLGILLEDDYKKQPVSGVLAALAKRFKPDALKVLDRNPLAEEHTKQGSLYRKVNYETALSVFGALQAGPSEEALRKFFYISAEDIFRPFVPSDYIATKRQAEDAIARLVATQHQEATQKPQSLVEPYFIRPSLIYHPHVAPWTPLPATLLDASAQIQKRLPAALQATSLASALDALAFVSPQLASVLPKNKHDLPLFTNSIANLLSIPPIHSDTIAEAICRLIEAEQPSINPVYGVQRMREIVGFPDAQAGQPEPAPVSL